LQLATLGVVCGVVALLSDGAWAVASGTARAWLGRSPRRLEWMSASGGVTMIALGAGLAITGAAADRTRHTPPARDRDADSASLADGPESSALRRPAPRAAVVPWQPRGRRSSSVAIPRL
jgi:hypothetical protein